MPASRSAVFDPSGGIATPTVRPSGAPSTSSPNSPNSPSTTVPVTVVAKLQGLVASSRLPHFSPAWSESAITAGSSSSNGWAFFMIVGTTTVSKFWSAYSTAVSAAWVLLAFDTKTVSAKAAATTTTAIAEPITTGRRHHGTVRVGAGTAMALLVTDMW